VLLTIAAVVALLALGVALVRHGLHADVLAKAVGGQDQKNYNSKKGDFGNLIDIGQKLTDAAMLPVIAIAPLAAVAGAFALMLGGGGRQGGAGAKLIAGAIGAVVIVAGAKGLAA
jgi:hypothetical protein